MWQEAELVSERENQRLSTEATLIQAAAASIMSKEGGGYFRGLIDLLRK